MEESSPLSLLALPILITILAISFSLHLIFDSKHASNNRKKAPEAGGSWPLLGHLHLLGGPKPPHLVLSQMADKYGPIFTIRLGIHRAIVVSTREIAKECLTTHDRAFATRPRTVGSEVMGYNFAMVGLSFYGPYWREVRKISILQLLSSRRIELLRHICEFEVLTSIRGLYEQCRTKIGNGIKASRTEKQKPVLVVDMKRLFGDIALNIMLRMIVGRRFNNEDGGDEKVRKALRDFFDLLGRFVVSDGLPFLRWLDPGGHEKAMKRTAEEMDRVVQEWLDEHKLRRKLREEAGEANGEQEDFMDVMLSILEGKEELHSYDADTVNKATCMSMVLAASDTTTVTLIWALSLLLNHRESLKKVQQELDALIGKDRQVKESDFNNLPYLQAVIKETLRLYPAGPLSVPHEAIEDCKVSGYFIPKGTRLILNLYKIHRDPRVWPDSSEFQPERFLTTHKDVDLRGQNFELIPFSSGRRMCPGVSLALQVLGLALGSFLHAFEITTPGGEAVDMEEAIGLTNLKASPLEVLITPRIPNHIYQ